MNNGVNPVSTVDLYFLLCNIPFFTKVTPLCSFSPEYPVMPFVLHSPPYKSIDNLEHVKTRKFRLMAIIIKWMQWWPKNITKYKVTCLKSVTDCHYRQVARMSHYREKSLKSILTKSEYCLLNEKSLIQIA